MDGKLASAEIANFSELDVQNSSRWYQHEIFTGNIEFLWGFNVIHPTIDFRYYITKPTWNPNQALTRNSFDLTPFCIVDENEMNPPSPSYHNWYHSS